MLAADPAIEPVPETLNSSRIGAARVAIGLTQGLALYLLYHAAQTPSWPATEPLLFAPLLLVALLAPLITISSLGHLTHRQAALWVGIVTVLAAAMGWYDRWRAADIAILPKSAGPSERIVFLIVAGFFIAHALVLAGARDRRRIASYASYFEIAWKLAVQLTFSSLFVGVTWLVLLLGGQLFELIQLDFLKRWIHQSWFAIPVTAFAYACAMHLTDVRPAIVRGIRSLLLVMMSWILPVMTLIVGAFLLSLPFTGLAPLWATRHAGSVLLTAVAGFVILVNAAWQDGAAFATAARVVRASARATAVLLVPLTVIAIYALTMRVRDYGWTNERVYAAACLLVASCYTFGYAYAAVTSGSLGRLANVNVASAFVVLATLLLLLSPIADPARLSVNDQLARLSSGRITAEKFDFTYLRFEGQRYGREALAQFATRTTGKDAELIRKRAVDARALRDRWDRVIQPPASIALSVHVWPEGARLPESFLRQNVNDFHGESAGPQCLRDASKTCDAYLLDLTGDGKPEVILLGEPFEQSAVMAETTPGRWEAVAWLPFEASHCGSLRSAMKAGQLRAVPSTINDIEVAGQRLRVSLKGEVRCAPTASGHDGP
ncbi:DUF4153 domain-containing protein [Massilia horti]|uniref:DUF4153 domain-containing protein n=1 Tax=Massilia horti TaxID=2562153 RepID=A0A4Y9SMF0_9BURK|nr:DUF4153 domain-containing protein [Massilia horti]TFW27845.1 DUF4153 domain-containing protein [Massilia horti]